MGDTDNTRKFLDYEGLKEFWKGLKTTFAKNADLQDLQDAFDNFKDLVNENNDGVSDSLTNILNRVSKLSPLDAENYSDALEKAKDALLGSVIYVKNKDENYPLYNTGAYIVTTGVNGRNLLYINTHAGNINLEDADINTIMSTLSEIQNQIDAFPGSYVEQKEFDDTINEINDRISANGSNFKVEVVQKLPTNGVPGTMYLVPSTTSADKQRYTDYICFNHKDLGIVYEKIGVGLEDLSNYVTSDEYDSFVSEINNKIDAFNDNTIAIVKGEITSMNSGTIGAEMSITKTDIENLFDTV